MRWIFFVLFFIIALAIIFSAHFLVYKSTLRFFSISNNLVKKTLIFSMIFLSVSYILASLLTRFDGNIFVTIYYYISGLWYGFLINLMLVSALGWGIYYALKYFGQAGQIKIIAYILFGLAILFTIYGAIEARNPKLKFLEVPIKNLPGEWEGKTAVQISDLHAGAINDVKYVEKIADMIKSVNPDIIFITGDFFDGTCPHPGSFIPPLNELNPPAGIYFVTGNHETYEGLDKVVAVLQKSKVKMLRDENINIKGLNIIGIEYPSQGMSKDIRPVLKLAEKNTANILLYHQPTSIKQAREAGINLQLAGHVHKGQIWPINFITRLIYGKYHYGYFNEGDYSIYTSSGAGSWGPPIRTSGDNEIVVLKFRKE